MQRCNNNVTSQLVLTFLEQLQQPSMESDCTEMQQTPLEILSLMCVKRHALYDCPVMLVHDYLVRVIRMAIPQRTI